MCCNALTDRNRDELREELVVALMTDNGKYGLFLVEEITISSIQIKRATSCFNHLVNSTTHATDLFLWRVLLFMDYCII